MATATRFPPIVAPQSERRIDYLAKHKTIVPGHVLDRWVLTTIPCRALSLPFRPN